VVRRLIAGAVLLTIAIVAVLAYTPSLVEAAPKGVAAFFPQSPPAAGTGGGLNNPQGVGVYAATGDIYVANQGSTSGPQRIERFSSTGEFELAWGKDVLANGPGSTGWEVCTVAQDCKNGTTGGLGGEFSSPQGLAIDQNDGSVYVVERQSGGRVQKFTKDGEFVWAAGKDVVAPGGTGNVPVVVPPVPERQTVTLSAFDILGCFCPVPVTGGTFTLTFDGQITGEIPYNAPATGDTTGGIDSVQEALEGLSNVDPGEVSVTGAAGGMWTVNFIGDLAGVNHSQMTGNSSGLAHSGTSASVTVATTQEGQAASETGNAEVCVERSECKATPPGTQGGEFAAIAANTSNGGGAGVAVVPAGVVGRAGNVLVTDPGNRRVQEFTAAGAFVRAFGFNVASAGTDNTGSGFEVCSATGSGAANCSTATAGSGVGQFGTNGPTRIAVDSTGTIYTVETPANFRVQKFMSQAGPPALLPAIVNPNIGSSGPALNLTGTGTTTAPLDIAVGPSDHVLVLKAFAVGLGTPPAAVAERRVVELDAAGALVDTHMALAGVGQGLAPTFAPSANNLAVNPTNGDTYVGTGGNSTNSRVFVLGSSVAPSVSMGVGGVNPNTAQLTGLVNPGGPNTAIGVRTGYHFEYRKIAAPAWTALSTDVDAGNGFAIVPVVATLADLEANTAYEAKLVASKPFSGVASIETASQSFTTPPAGPDIKAVYVTDRDATSVALHAQISANNSSTSYRFEYGTTAAYGTSVPMPDGNAGSGATAQHFTETLSGLTPDAEYHYRVVATNANATTKSPDRVFTTRTAGPVDGGRAYELVSPADKVGGQGVGAWYAGSFSHATAGFGAYDGDRYSSFAFYGGVLVDGDYSYGGDWTLGERTPQGWINGPAINRRGGYGDSEPYKIAILGGATADMSLMSWTSTNTMLRLFPEQEAWGSTGVTGQLLREWESGKWEPIGPTDLATQTPHPSGGFAAQVFTDTAQLAADGGYVATSGPMRGLTGPGDPTLGSWGDLAPPARSVYFDDVSTGLSDTFPGDGVRALVNVCTGAGDGRTVVPSVDAGGKISAQTCPAPLAGRDERLIDSRGAALRTTGGQRMISDDGSRVFFMSPDPGPSAHNASCGGSGAATQCPPQLYVRQRDSDGSATTRWISRSQVPGQAASLTSTALFEGASADGDKVFFRTAAPLTADDPNGGTPVSAGVKTGTPSPNSVDLYMYDLPDAPGADPGDGTLTRISAGPAGIGDGNVSSDSTSPGGGDPAGDGGGLRAVSADGLRVYFVTSAPIAGVPAPSSGTSTSPGGTTTQTTTKNLYFYDAHRDPADRWRYIARLPASTPLGGCAAKGQIDRLSLLSGAQGLTPTVVVSDHRCVRTVSDGSFVTIWTDGQLIASDPNSSTGDLYAYDADADELNRVSAPQGGAGVGYTCAEAGGHQCFGDPGIGDGNTPGSLFPLGLVSDPDVPGDKVVFFESKSKLVVEDQNDAYDVYQWRNGHLSLISTGAVGAEDALYRGNDRTGKNVYISTRDRLAWQDHDAVLDVYTVRAGGGIPEPEAPVVCDVLAGGCHGGGADSVTTDTRTVSSGGDDASSEERKTLTVSALSAKARKRASRTGNLVVSVRTTGAGRVSALAKGRIGKRVRRVAHKSIQVAKAGGVTLRLRLSRPARQQLKRGKALKLTIQVASPGARTRARTVRLPGVSS
jgi:hypothetical protein